MAIAILLFVTFLFSFFAPEQPAYDVLLVVDVVLLVFGLLIIIIRKNLLPYLFRRLGETVVTLFLIVTFVFILLRVMPGGPFDRDKQLPPEVMANIAAKYHLDKPPLMQYMLYLKGVVAGDFGESYKYLGRNVSDIIADSFPASLKLGIYALMISCLIGIPLGIFAAARHNTAWDTGAMMFAMFGVTLPSFLVSAIFILIFAYTLQILPPGLWEGPSYYILPVVTLGIRPAAIIARLTRASALEIIQSDFIRTAYAKGLSQKVVLFKHVLKNSLLPVLTYMGPLTADTVTGAFIIEHIFSIPGLGKHFIASVQNRDYPLVMGLALLYSIILVASNLIVDLFFSIIDPRIRLT